MNDRHPPRTQPQNNRMQPRRQPPTRTSCRLCDDTFVVWNDMDTKKMATRASKNVVASWCPICGEPKHEEKK